MVDRWEDSGRWRWFLPTLLLATAAAKLALAWLLPGFLTGDDLEIVETAAKYAAGLDYTPSAIRSFFHPLVLAWPAVRLGVLAGLGGPRWLTFLAALPTIAFSTAGIWILYRLARTLGWSPAESRAAAWLYALHWLPLGFGATSFPRPISTCLLLAAFLLIAEARGGTDAGALAAGALAAAATAVRWSEGVALAPLLGFAASRTRRLRPVVLALAGFGAAFALCAGLLDAWTWGRPFASLAAFIRLARDPNLGGFQPRPALWYATMALQWAGPVLLGLAAWSWPDRRSRAPLAIALSVVVLESLSPVKQMRYLQAAVPFLALAGALGWERLRGQGASGRRLAAAALAVSVVVGLERTAHLLRGKSEAALAAAKTIAAAAPPARRVTLEQGWAYGDRLYLGNSVEIRDLAPRRPLDAESVRAAAAGSDAVALYAADVDAEVERALAISGFRICARFERLRSPAVVLSLPASRPCPAGPPDLSRASPRR